MVVGLACGFRLLVWFVGVGCLAGWGVVTLVCPVWLLWVGGLRLAVVVVVLV